MFAACNMKAMVAQWRWVSASLALLGSTPTWAQAIPLPPPPPGLPPPATSTVVRPTLITTNGGTTIIRPSANPVVPQSPPMTKSIMIQPPGQTGGPSPFIGPMPPRVLPPPVMPVTTTPPNALAFDAETKQYTAKPGEISASFTFHVTNTANVEVQVNNVHTSCGCTVAKLPAHPWRIAPGTGGPIGVTVDLRGKRGVLAKSVTVQSTSGVKNLLVSVTIPDETGTVNLAEAMSKLDPDRVKNIQISLADRQAVFKKADCAECHADKAKGQMGKDLYDAVCVVCHDTPHRATMVTDLKAKHPYTPEIWRQWITYGKTNTLMPAFAVMEGGPLTHEQINSLVEYAVKAFPPGTAQPSLSPLPQTLAMPVVQPPRPMVRAQPSGQPMIQPGIRPSPVPVRTTSPLPPPPVVPAMPHPPAVPISDFPFPKDK